MHSGRGRGRWGEGIEIIQWGIPFCWTSETYCFIVVHWDWLDSTIILYRNAILQFCDDKWHRRVLVHLRAYIKSNKGARAKCLQDFNHQYGRTNLFEPASPWTNGLIDYKYVHYPPPLIDCVVFQHQRVLKVANIIINIIIRDVLVTRRAEVSEL